MSDITMPNNIGSKILETASVIQCGLLNRKEFIDFCVARKLKITEERLINLEKLEVFFPVFLMHKPKEGEPLLTIPSENITDWFKDKKAIDPTNKPDRKDEIFSCDKDVERYYSIFQVIDLEVVLSSLTLNLDMERFLVSDAKEINREEKGQGWLQPFKNKTDSLKANNFGRDIAMLCQFISNRYYPQSQSNKREINIVLPSHFSEFMQILGDEWDWCDYAKNWDPKEVEKLFGLTKEKLKEVYSDLASVQRSCDPLEQWYHLVQFISVAERKKLKGDALRAETIRSAAYMIGLLYKDLYGEVLKHPNEYGLSGTAWLEEEREDPLRYLEFVANRFTVNPQPKAVMIVEGASEARVIPIIFEEYFGIHPSVVGIEILDMRSVDNAVGGRKAFYSAILRLIDYLHFHQTFTFVILDNENNSDKFKDVAEKATSIHFPDRKLTKRDYIDIWDKAFELDNFSCDEIAVAMNEELREKDHTISKDVFDQDDICTCKEQKDPVKAISDLYKAKTSCGLNKPDMNEKLVRNMLKGSYEDISKRPIIEKLLEFKKLAGLNHLPTEGGIWKSNQESGYLGDLKKK